MNTPFASSSRKLVISSQSEQRAIQMKEAALVAASDYVHAETTRTTYCRVGRPVNVGCDAVPVSWTAAKIMIAIPTAMRPYLMAVSMASPELSFRKRRTSLLTLAARSDDQSRCIDRGGTLP